MIECVCNKMTGGTINCLAGIVNSTHTTRMDSFAKCGISEALNECTDYSDVICELLVSDWDCVNAQVSIDAFPNNIRMVAFAHSLNTQL